MGNSSNNNINKTAAVYYSNYNLSYTVVVLNENILLLSLDINQKLA